MQTILILVLWFPGTPMAPTSLSVEFSTAAACEDAKDTLLSRLGTRAVYVLECVPKGEIRT